LTAYDVSTIKSSSVIENARSTYAIFDDSYVVQVDIVIWVFVFKAGLFDLVWFFLGFISRKDGDFSKVKDREENFCK